MIFSFRASLSKERVVSLLFFLIAGLIFARLPVTWLLTIVVGFAAVGCVVVRPAWGLALLALAIPFSTLGEIQIAGATVSIAEAALVLVLLSWLLAGLARRKITLPRPFGSHEKLHSPVAGVFLPLLALAGVVTASLLQAESFKDALPEVLKWIETLALYVVAVSLLQARPIQPKTQNNTYRWLVAALILGACLEAALGLYQFFRQVGPPAFQILGRFLRAYGTFRQPNPFAGYLGLLLPLALSLAWWQLGQWHRAFQQKRKLFDFELGLLAVLALATGLIAAGIVASWSRGAWFGIGAGALVVTALRNRRAFAISVALAVVLGAALLLRGGVDTGAAGNRFGAVAQYFGGFDVETVEVNDDNFAVVERVAHWRAAERMIEESPWFGIGAGNYAVVYPRVALPRWPDALGHAHNIYLHMWAETGIFGLLAYLIVWIAAGWQAWRLAHDQRISGFQRAVALGVLGAIIHLSVHNFFDNLLVQRMYLLLALLLALLAPRVISPEKHKKAAENEAGAVSL